MAPLKLPPELINRGDAQRIMRELSSLNDFYVGVHATKKASGPPKLSKVLEDLAALNKADLNGDKSRQELYQKLQNLEKSAPNLHISFASEATGATLQPIITWLRQNIHPEILLSVGYQPRIAAGCVLRTPNKLIDMSMGAHLEKQAPKLMKLLEGTIHGA